MRCPRFLQMLKHLAPGDVVTVTRIDRLARRTFDLWPSRGPTPAPAPGGLMIAVLAAWRTWNATLSRTAEGRSRAQ
jgi:Resolvase, N terminal domain